MSIHSDQDSATSVLERLRALAPRRILTLSEALHIAERQATLLLQLQGIEELPVPDEVITSLRRLVVRSDDSLPDAVLGCGDWDRFRRTWIITVSARGPHTQRRVTMAHEYKHILDYNSPGLAARRRSDAVDLGTAPEELVADFFAACLLMPRGALKTAWASGQQDIAQLAIDFAVPAPVMQARLLELGLSRPIDQAARPVHRDVGYSVDLGRRLLSRTTWSCPNQADRRCPV